MNFSQFLDRVRELPMQRTVIFMERLTCGAPWTGNTVRQFPHDCRGDEPCIVALVQRAGQPAHVEIKVEGKKSEFSEKDFCYLCGLLEQAGALQLQAAA